MNKNAKAILEKPLWKDVRKAAANEITRLHLYIKIQLVVNVLLAVAVIVK